MEEILPQCCCLIILTYAESLQPEADGCYHVFPDTKPHYCVRSIEVAIF